MITVTDEEISAFHTRYCPFAERIYRGALIVTGSSKFAEQLQVDVYLKAFVEYLHAAHLRDFESWLAEIAGECIAEFELHHRSLPFETNAVYETFVAMLTDRCDCRPRQHGTSQKYVAMPN